MYVFDNSLLNKCFVLPLTLSRFYMLECACTNNKNIIDNNYSTSRLTWVLATILKNKNSINVTQINSFTSYKECIKLKIILLSNNCLQRNTIKWRWTKSQNKISSDPILETRMHVYKTIHNLNLPYIKLFFISRIWL